MILRATPVHTPGSLVFSFFPYFNPSRFFKGEFYLERSQLYSRLLSDVRLPLSFINNFIDVSHYDRARLPAICYDFMHNDSLVTFGDGLEDQWLYGGTL